MKKLTKKTRDKFANSLKSAVVEKDVEHAYKTVISEAFETEGGYWDSRFQSDGYFRNGLFLRLLMETKFNERLLQKKVKCETLAQALYYIKRFEENGEELPNVVLIGDVDECFVVTGSVLYKYLKEDLDWSIAPSDAARANPSLIVKMIDDKGIAPFVFDVSNSKNDFNDVIRVIEQLSTSGEAEKVPITEHNIRVVYDSFLRCLFPKKTKLRSDQLVSVFVQSMTDPVNCYLHPNKPNILVMKNGDEIPITGLDYYAFFTRFDRNYSAEEIGRLIEIADRLIIETERRYSGDFWTPSSWADEAHRRIAGVLGEDWQKKWTLWDCACGTKNLTRDLYLDNAYLSTLHQSELDMSSEYNPEATCFQFDFLNDDMDLAPNFAPQFLEKVPERLYADLCADKPLLFLINPPYGTANDFHSDESHKKGIAKTEVNALMRADGMGKASQQLFTQFLYRIMVVKQKFNLSNVAIGIFMVPSLYSPTEYWEKLAERFFDEFDYRDGFLFNAGEFSNVKDKWAVSFSVLTSKDKDAPTEKKDSFAFDVYDRNKLGDLSLIGRKKLSFVPKEKSLKEWARTPIADKKNDPGPWPRLSSGLTTTKTSVLKNMTLGYYGYIVCNSNDVGHSDKNTWVCSGPIGYGHGMSVCEENFSRCGVLFSARKVCDWSWFNEKDQFRIPDEENPGFAEFEADCMVLSVFHKDMQAASADSLEYLGKDYELVNEWFPFSKNDMAKLAGDKKHLCMPMYNSAIQDDERAMYLYLQKAREQGSLSPQSQEVLKEALSILKKTFAQRVAFSDSLPDLYLKRWDAGWYQIKRAFSQEEYREISRKLRSALTILSEKVRSQVYALGILDSMQQEPLR